MQNDNNKKAHRNNLQINSVATQAHVVPFCPRIAQDGCSLQRNHSIPHMPVNPSSAPSLPHVAG